MFFGAFPPRVLCGSSLVAECSFFVNRPVRPYPVVCVLLNFNGDGKYRVCTQRVECHIGICCFVVL